ncbi:MAG: 50S ribosomal protein L24 [Rhodothermales bacterium]|nr:50S ribosomal protein L24 [Rhodothermales bacterium]
MRKVNPQQKLHVKKGDQVALTKAITGVEPREKGYVGRVLKVFPKTSRVVVEGVNVRVRHTKPNRTNPQGGRIEREVPIHISNVMPVDSNGNPTRVGRKRIEDPETGKGRWVRYAKTTGEELDK